MDSKGIKFNQKPKKKKKILNTKSYIIIFELKNSNVFIDTNLLLKNMTYLRTHIIKIKLFFSVLFNYQFVIN